MEQQSEPFEPVAPKTSRLGIASVALSVLGIVFWCIPFSAGLFIGFTGNMDLLPTLTPLNYVGNCGNFLGVIGMILGGISVYQDQKKGLGIAGLVLGILLTCGCLASAAYNLSTTL